MKPLCLALPVAMAVLVTSSFAAAVKDREGAVRNDRATLEKDARWIYNDVAKGFTEAKWKGKPLLVVLRCVPCLSCAGIDASVLQEPDLAPLLDQFVCVRVINANALDLSLFQFDYDLSFSALLFNADRTVYGRFGSWTHQKNQHDKSIAGFQRALESGLAIHRGYPANKPSLAGKQGVPSPYRTPVNIPALDGNYRLALDWQGKVVPSCVHCHQIGDALRATYRKLLQPVPSELIYPMPAPQAVGLTLAPDAVARIDSVAPGSAAARAGFRVKDEIISLASQPLVSIADVSWVLHRAPESGSLIATIKRGSATKKLTIALALGWRSSSDISDRVGTWGLRGMAAGGLVLEDLPDDIRASRGLAKTGLALRVKYVGQYGTHAAGKKAGFQLEDVIVEIAGLTGRLTEGQLLGHLLQNHPAGEQVKTAVLRGQQRVELTLPMQ